MQSMSLRVKPVLYGTRTLLSVFLVPALENMSFSGDHLIVHRKLSIIITLIASNYSDGQHEMSISHAGRTAFLCPSTPHMQSEKVLQPEDKKTLLAKNVYLEIIDADMKV